MKRISLVSLAWLMAACGGGGSSPGSPPTAVSPQVAGQYTVSVRLLDNDCGAAPTVLPQATSVQQTPGASAFSLTHGGLRVTGSVERDGAFTTQPLSVQDALGPATLAVVGRFTTSGLDATVTVDVSPIAPAPACRYRVGWTGTKQGSPNVLG
jgi:hypothetical protein